MGKLLAALLSAIGIGIAWGMFVFWGAVSHVTLLSLFMTGVGAGIGSFAAWLKIDLAPPTSVLVVVSLVLMLTGIGGAWGGFQFGAGQDVPCCAGPVIGPITYTVLGATIAANVVAPAMGLIHGIGRHKDRPGFRTEGPSSAAGASGEAGPPKVPYGLFAGKGLMISGGLR